MKTVSLGFLTLVIRAAEKGKFYVSTMDANSAFQFVEDNFNVLAVTLGAVIIAEWIMVALLSI